MWKCVWYIREKIVYWKLVLLKSWQHGLLGKKWQIKCYMNIYIEYICMFINTNICSNIFIYVLVSIYSIFYHIFLSYIIFSVYIIWHWSLINKKICFLCIRVWKPADYRLKFHIQGRKLRCTCSVWIVRNALGILFSV